MTSTPMSTHSTAASTYHARSMYLCILDQSGQTVFHKNIRTDPERFLQAIAPFREGLVVAVECVFCWYWLADLCRREGITFILGHALYYSASDGYCLLTTKAIYGLGGAS
jgi:hypothetical protein